MSTTPVIAQHRAAERPFRFDPAAVSAHAADAVAADSGYVLREHDGADRASVERFIARRFARSFGARVNTFMPRLFSLRERDGAPCGALGLRCASRRLFIEQYLDQPIETAIARHTGIATARASIIEVGHLCGAFPGAMRTMIALLAERLHRDGFAWVAFAGTTSLRNAFARVGMHPVAVAAARIERLAPDARAAWGSYYEHRPRVLVGRVEDGVRALGGSAGPRRAR